MGAGCGPPNPPDIGGAGRVWGFNHFQVVNYLIFLEKVQEFSPRSLQVLALFDFKKAQRHYPTRFSDLFSKPLFKPSTLRTASGIVVW
ncbi:MAG: hypothetical protein EWV55_17650 [Microcystis viridis Mv_BB_P_19951000_S69]|uniref:Uncharacterized protein n=1 Tax=Microcystis viridis Mv_BB_P_19951000_S68D TaxID=2486270 RepID=A0A552HLL3_MICVR|nr:MAG: hypothetical protein EWV47_18710 [Microcystis viridis Mv_BB_P_19951000_S68]TRU71135.1 MAG: hypothetical protein EWV55_17650 [Microcystis viridis Mv_BB_P_19951000_S69]TRU72076.1 MAG: hypothetical protein EWV77_14165 [Microcystis viridis Mv_BB_P_19951000_S68D]TRU85955.1 MAG: hypothetical protein EWV46_11325 [Microcystis viridis Mv_BB_P_19951000_S69D]